VAVVFFMDLALNNLIDSAICLYPNSRSHLISTKETKSQISGVSLWPRVKDQNRPGHKISRS